MDLVDYNIRVRIVGDMPQAGVNQLASDVRRIEERHLKDFLEDLRTLFGGTNVLIEVGGDRSVVERIPEWLETPGG